MPKSRKKYTEEFKREAVRAMELRGERTVGDVAKSLGVPENILHQWRKKLGSQIADFARNASWSNALLLGLTIVLWIAVCLAVQFVVTWWSGRRS